MSASDPVTDSTGDADQNWIGETIGGTVERFERLAGGGSHITSLVDVRRPDGDLVELILQRAAAGPYSVGNDITPKREQVFHLALQETSIAIPPILGITPDGEATLTARLPGSDDYYGLGDAERQLKIRRSYLTKLAELHGVPPSSLDLPGYPIPQTPQDLARDWLGVWRRFLEDHVSRPAPLVRFAIQWLERHAPTTPGKTVICHGDLGPGNFMFDGDEVTGLIDWELVHIGDVHDDLGMLALRAYQLGQIGGIEDDLKFYQEISGSPIDVWRVKYYRAVALVLGIITSLVQLDRRGGDRIAVPLFLRLVPALECVLAQALVDLVGVDVDEPALVAPQAGAATSTTSTTTNTYDAEVIEALAESVHDLPPAAANVPGPIDMVMYLEARDQYGKAIDEAERDDLADLLGARPASVVDGWRALDEKVAEGKLEEAKLLRWGYRATKRQASFWPGLDQMTPLMAIGPLV